MNWPAIITGAVFVLGLIVGLIRYVHATLAKRVEKLEDKTDADRKLIAKVEVDVTVLKDHRIGLADIVAELKQEIRNLREAIQSLEKQVARHEGGPPGG